MEFKSVSNGGNLHRSDKHVIEQALQSKNKFPYFQARQIKKAQMDKDMFDQQGDFLSAQYQKEEDMTERIGDSWRRIFFKVIIPANSGMK